MEKKNIFPCPRCGSMDTKMKSVTGHERCRDCFFIWISSERGVIGYWTKNSGQGSWWGIPIGAVPVFREEAE